MTDIRTEEIRARLAAATPAPWEVVAEAGGDGFSDWATYGVKPVCEPHGTDDMAEISAGLDSLDPADAALIANAPADLAYLLGRVEALEAENARLQSVNGLDVNDWFKIAVAKEQALDATCAERDRYRAVVDAAKKVRKLRLVMSTPDDVEAAHGFWRALDNLNGGE